MKLAKLLLVALIVLTPLSTDAEARLFGRRANSRVNRGGGTESFPPNTPPAPMPTNQQVCTPQGCYPAQAGPQMVIQ